MTTIFVPVLFDHVSIPECKKWIWANLWKHNEAKTWHWILSDDEKRHVAILFAFEEDAVAFKLRFGV